MKPLLVFDDHFTHGHRKLPLSAWQRFLLRVNGRVYVLTGIKEGWKTPFPFYVAKCKIHGYYLDYPKGGRERLTCPQCMKEEEVKVFAPK